MRWSFHFSQNTERAIFSFFSLSFSSQSMTLHELLLCVCEHCITKLRKKERKYWKMPQKECFQWTIRYDVMWLKYIDVCVCLACCTLYKLLLLLLPMFFFVVASHSDVVHYKRSRMTSMFKHLDVNRNLRARWHFVNFDRDLVT